jgi:hypothetical protein
MFIENKYKKIYFDLIEKRKQEPYTGEYAEKHHILPKSLGGSNDSSNLVCLSLREHFIAHRLLSKITNGSDNIKMMWALHRMIFSKKYSINSKTYEFLRANHILFLKENHHSKRIDGWKEKMCELAYASWKNDEARRNKFSLSMKQKISEWKKKDPEGYLEEQRRRSKVGAQRAAEVTKKNIEYNGVLYVGWSELMEKTGISRHLYNKFYKNGVDPSFRVGKDGPMTIDDIKTAIKLFYESLMEIEPIEPQEKKIILTRMVNKGMISSALMRQFCKQYNI